MKKIMTLIFLLTLTIVGSAAAEDSSLGFLNLNGTTYYIPALKSLAVGSGIEFASLQDGLVGIRGDAITTIGDEKKTLFGLGVGVNLPKLLNKAGGKWTADVFNPSVNAAIFTSLSGGVKPYLAIGVDVITIELK